MKQICFFDIDSTLLSHVTKCVPQSTITAIKTLKSKGIKCFIATSRSFVEITNLPQEVMDLMDGFICEGGAKVVYQNKVIIQHLLDEESKNKLMDMLNTHQLAFRYCGNQVDINYLDHEDEYAFSRFDFLYAMIPPIKKYQTQPLTHVLFYCFDDAVITTIKSSLPKLEFINIGNAFDVTAKNVTKGTTLQQVCDYFSIPVENSVCFGDSANDLEMIRCSGLGIAMGNGAQCVKDIADYVTSDIDDNGIYNACVHFNWFN